MHYTIFQSVFLALAVRVAAGADAPAPAAGVRLETYTGWDNSLSLSGGDCRAIIAPAVGGRMVVFSLNADNILFEDPATAGKTLASTPEGFAVGGYQCDLGPLSSGLPDRLTLWLGAWSWKSPRPGTVVLQSDPHPGLGIQLEKEITLDPDSGELGLVQRMKNTSPADKSYALWDRTACKPGGFILVPVSKKSRFKGGWSLGRTNADGKVVFEGGVDEPRAKVLDGVLVVDTRGLPLRGGVDSEAGWMAYTVGQLLLVKYFPVSAKGGYGGAGNTVEFCSDARATELGPLSPVTTLKPSETRAFPEKWVLSGLNKSVASRNEARNLVKRLPPSPF